MDRDPNHVSVSSDSDFLRNVQAAFKRHRSSFGPMQSSTRMLPKRSVVPQPQNKCTQVNCEDVPEDASLTSPPISATLSNFKDDHYPKHHPVVDPIKKVNFSFPTPALSQELEWEANEPKHHIDGGSRLPASQNQLHHFSTFLQNDAVVASSSSSSSSCATTTSVHATSAPIPNSTTHSSCPLKHTDAILKSHNISSLSNVPITQTGDNASKDLSSHPKPETTKSDKQEKPPSRKKGYDPDSFFKVNGKLYQRLGKIGSGGSSEVHKVISSDCTIYALKKIRLKGRDYSTALGFCQEIVYLKKLKGKDNIIQLIDYEVTDKSLLQEAMNGPSSNSKDNKVKDDGFIYMVLEYGEIDLAHMLSQKWKEMERSNSTMDENWLRFYWQQILLAVNTIHEERIVHSDLKPANFLLVKGSLKLIDFGIAKAIMSDTTNIQRDAQVGTLSYMSPEAFMCNETDANGNVIKCGRPSDIWSLGCILYQMVYGKTPFSEYRTFWSKFKVITDPNHKITYGPVSNPYLLDLMKKCLTWERNDRWRIPQLLKHPFLVPPLQPDPDPVPNYRFLRMISDSCTDDNQVSTLCSELQSVLGDTSAASRPDQVNMLSQISSICLQLKELITKTN